MGIGQVTLVTMPLSHVEIWFILSPHNKGGRLVGAEIFLKGGKHFNIAFIRTIQFILHFRITGPAHAFPVEQPGFRAYTAVEFIG